MTYDNSNFNPFTTGPVALTSSEIRHCTDPILALGYNGVGVCLLHVGQKKPSMMRQLRWAVPNNTE